MEGRIRSINISARKGQGKVPIAMGNLIEDFGLEGDAHGGNGPRQVSLMAKESIDRMRRYNIAGLCIEKFSENITTEGIALNSIGIGARFMLGNAVLEISSIGKGCHRGCKILKKGERCAIATEAVFARVIKGGLIKPGDIIKPIIEIRGNKDA